MPRGDWLTECCPVCLVAVVSNRYTGTVCCMSSGSDAPDGSWARRGSELHTHGDDGSWASST